MNITELLSSPSMMHAAVVHMPIAAAALGLLFVILSAIFHRNNTVRALTALLFLISAVSAYVAIETGEDARDLVPNTLPGAIWDQLTAHAAGAEKVLYASAFTFACLLISLIRWDALRVATMLLAAVGAIATNVFCANTGHLGGALVYNHGVGTPAVHQPPAPADTPEASPAPESTPAPMPEETPVATVPPADDPEWLPIREFTAEEAAQVSFIRDVWPILDDQCVMCHENPDADGDYDMTTVENMMKGGKKGGPGIIPGNPDESSIIKYIRGIAKPRMPEDEPPLPDEMLHTLRMWIAAGAPDDSAAPAPESAPVPVEAVPVEADVPVEPMPEASPAEVPAAPEATPETAGPSAVEAPAPEVAPEAPVTESAPEAPAAEEVPVEAVTG